MFRAPRRTTAESVNGFTHPVNQDEFRRRQQADLMRYTDIDGDYVVRRRPFHERLEGTVESQNDNDVAIETDDDQTDSEEALPEAATEAHSDDGEEAWRNKEGERLADFGVDEIADFYDEDDLPLADLLRKRQAER